MPTISFKDLTVTFQFFSFNRALPLTTNIYKSVRCQSVFICKNDEDCPIYNMKVSQYRDFINRSI